MVQSQVPSSASTVLNSEIFRVDGTFEARNEDCPTGHCASEMINKCPSLIHLMVVMRADGRTIPGIHEACHEERMMSLCHDAQCDHPPVSIVHQECLPTSYNNIYNIPNI